ncbi:hypothetical protein EVAR_37568_1 [Eumeta japonica]|uniref:Uncharacterized protein n=1 Tax=Eumeta variegata TaxID=151549 RepID=A0A4C1XQ92_EUMVA|nr:hypothetical protein EVAR_37568_1 [Eumeta japonica]
MTSTLFDRHLQSLNVGQLKTITATRSSPPSLKSMTHSLTAPPVTDEPIVVVCCRRARAPWHLNCPRHLTLASFLPPPAAAESDDRGAFLVRAAYP